MSELLDTFRQRHQEYLSQMKRREVGEGLVEKIQGLVTDLREAGEVIADPAERGQLRALIQFWGSVIYDHTGVYPITTLLPLDPSHTRPSEEPARRPLPPLTWMLVGAAAIIIIVVGVLAIGQMSLPSTTLEETLPPAKAPRVSYAAAGTGLGEDGALKMAAETFCLDTPNIFSNFALEGMQPGTELRWELLREDEVVSAHPASPWGQDPQYVTIRVRGTGEHGVEPGHYDLLLFANDQTVGFLSFEVLDTAPHISDLQVADVPTPAAGSSDGVEFEPGVRVIYLTYDYEGLCTGLELSHTLYRDGEPIQQTTETWRGAPQGRAQAVFQAPDGVPFTSGDYEVAVTVAGEEQGRVAFTIKEEEVEAPKEVEQEPEPIPPAFGEITFSLGVQPDGSPILTAVNDQFDWNTKVIYGTFDYIGMRDGMTWTAVWRRNGLEVGRQERFWNEKAFGTEGTCWTAYYDEYGRPLAGGNYSVTLYIDNVEQRTAGFRILYYTQ